MDDKTNACFPAQKGTGQGNTIRLSLKAPPPAGEGGRGEGEENKRTIDHKPRR